MTTKQYRWFGRISEQAMSGNALIAVQNNAGSGKLVKINRFSLYNLTKNPQNNGRSILSLVRNTNTATIVGGQNLARFDMDSTKTPPSNIHVMTGVGVTSTASDYSFMKSGLFHSAKSSLFSRMSTYKYNKLNSNDILSNISRQGPGGADDNICIRSGECISLIDTADSTQGTGNLYRLNVMLKVDNAGSISFHTYTCTTDIIEDNNQALLIIQNDSTSQVYLKKLEITECGTADTPYLQLVPVGALNPQSQTDIWNIATLSPVDSNYGNTTTTKLFLDAPILPKDVPEVYLADGSTGTPKGFNYLNTKDFNGPRYFVVFPEYIGKRSRAVTSPDNLSSSAKNDMVVKGAPIVLNSGESIALVSGAETAAGVTTAVGTSGWMDLYAEIILTEEPSIVVTLTGLKNPSEIRVFNANTTTELVGTGNESVTTGTHSFTLDVGTAVDISILSLGYQNTRILNYTTEMSVSIPISQVLDRQYSNI